jgi:hypothetical protein
MLTQHYTSCVITRVTTTEYRRALEAAIAEYESLGEERRRIDKRLSELAQTITTLSRLCGIVPSVPWGLTDACRTVLRNAGGPMTPVEVRDRLEGIGVDLSRYASDLAAVHTTLKRLNEAGEIRFIGALGGKRAFIWERPARPAGLGPAVAQVAREMRVTGSGRKKK